MAVEMTAQEDGKTLVVRATGRLTREDYERLSPEVDRLVREHGKISILFEMRDFHGWTGGAMWPDVKFGVKHFAHVDRLAIIGDRNWQKAMAIFCRPFTLARVRYFDRTHAEEAMEWLHRQPAAAA